MNGGGLLLWPVIGVVAVVVAIVVAWLVVGSLGASAVVGIRRLRHRRINPDGSAE